MTRRITGVALVAVVAGLVGVLIGYLAWGEEDDSADLDRATADRLHSQLTEAAEREESLTGRLRAAKLSAASSQQLVREMQLASGIENGFCSVRDVPQIRVRIASPSDGTAVASPVITHLVVADPVGCDATYRIAVDGTPYELQGPGDPTVPISAANPQASQPRPAGRPEFTCVSGVYGYLELDLEPGPHTVSVLSCPQGTGVPATVPTSVSFAVRHG